MTDEPQPLDEWLAEAGREYRRKLAQKKPRAPKAAKAPRELERDARKAMVAYLRKCGCIVSSNINEVQGRSSDANQRARFWNALVATGSTKAFPDLTVDPPNDWPIFYVECKRKGEKPRDSQEEMHARLRTRGRIVIVAYDVWSLQDEMQKAGIVLTRTGWRAPMAESVR